MWHSYHAHVALCVTTALHIINMATVCLHRNGKRSAVRGDPIHGSAAASRSYHIGHAQGVLLVCLPVLRGMLSLGNCVCIAVQHGYYDSLSVWDLLPCLDLVSCIRGSHTSCLTVDGTNS